MSRVLPILFNTEMVQAILDDRKTTTRRKIDIDISNQFDVESDGRTVVAYIDQATGDSYYPAEICRYRPGDVLYVRETWNYGYIEISDSPGNFDAWFEPLNLGDEHGLYIEALSRYFYKADEDAPGSDIGMVWRPSIHMPKAAARIWLRVTDIKIQRLQDMTLDDFLREGVIMLPEAFNDPENVYQQARTDFIDIWDSTIPKGEQALYGWAANPWIWAIEYERCEKPEPCILKGIAPAEDKRPCIGYQKSKEDDEPCEMCKGCKACDGEEPGSEE